MYVKSFLYKNIYKNLICQLFSVFISNAEVALSDNMTNYFKYGTRIYWKSI
jgi:hypothetical protein